MENASKALLMAGGILIAIIIIALIVRSFASVRIFQQTQLTQEEKEQLVAFNEQYTKYLGQYVYGTEVITVINRSLNNKSYLITPKIKDINGSEVNIDTFIQNPESRNKAFKCTNIEYDRYGRVNSITFEEKKWNDTI